MTESSNYDEAANSSPPAYGVWKKTGPNQFETKYLFYQTRAPVPADGPGNDNAWLPSRSWSSHRGDHAFRRWQFVHVNDQVRLV